MENQNPNSQEVKPDYRFITDQPAAPAPKNRTGKAYVLLGLVVVLLLLGGASLFFARGSRNLANTPTQTAADNTVKNFFSKIEAGSFAESHSMISELHRPAQQYFISGFAAPIQERYMLGQCAYSTDETEQELFIVNSTCPLKDGTGKYTFRFELARTEQPQIISFEVVGQS